MTATSPIMPRIERRGQLYFDEPVMVNPKHPDKLEYAVGRCFNSAQEMAQRVPRPIQVAWQQVMLNWKNEKRP